MKNIIKSFALMLALIVAMTLSVSVLAEDETSVVSDATSSEVNSSEDTSSEDTSSEDASSEAASSEDASSDAVSDGSSDAVVSTPETNNAATDSATEEEVASNFPWARVITLIVIVVLIIVAWVLTKTKTPIGQKLKKFFKEYWSEIKKVSWSSPKDTAKATGIVLVFLIVAAIAIGVLDLGFTYTVKKIAEIFSK